MSQLKLVADSGGGTIAIKAPANTTSNSAFELTLPGTGSRGLGKILQVVQGTLSSAHSNNSTTFQDTGLSASLTPTQVGSKILLQEMIQYNLDGGSNASVGGAFKTVRKVASGSFSDIVGHTPSNSTGPFTLFFGQYSSNDTNIHQVHNVSLLDTPSYSLGDSITYKVQSRMYSANGTIYASFGGGSHTQSISYMILMEVAG